MNRKIVKVLNICTSDCGKYCDSDCPGFDYAECSIYNDESLEVEDYESDDVKCLRLAQCKFDELKSNNQQ